MAIEDAVVLAACAEHTGYDFPSALRWYEEERYLRTARVQVTARYYGDIYHAAGVVREVRNWFLAPRPGADPNAKSSFEGMAWLYDGIKVPEAPRG